MRCLKSNSKHSHDNYLEMNIFACLGNVCVLAYRACRRKKANVTKLSSCIDAMEPLW